MPIYEYECAKCGHRFELIQKFADPPVKSCSQCKSRRVRRLVSAPAFQFKGEGWYVSDYSDKGKAAREQGKAEAKAAEPAAESKSTEAKPAKADSKGDAKGDAKSDKKPADKKPATGKSKD